LSSQPLAGRRIWLVGVGGAGLSAYGLLARAWGAEVEGWDRNETPYLDAVRAAGIDVHISPQPEIREGFEVFVSSAYAGVGGWSRAELLAELASHRRTIVVAGAHGKTTTAAMIAFALRETGGDPSWLVGGVVPQLGSNAGAGEGWLVVEGDESDRSLEALHPEIAVVTNVDLDHHAAFASIAEVEEFFADWLSEIPQAVRGWELDPVDFPLAIPGEHNRRNAAAALSALELADIGREEAEGALARFEGVTRRFERIGEAGGVAVYDDYAHNPRKVAAALDTARERADGGHVLVLFQPHLFSRTRHVAHELAAALARADVVCVTDVYPAREDPVEGVDGKLVVDALARIRPGAPIGWTPRLEDGARFIARRARPGDLVVTVGAGDVDRGGTLIVEELAETSRQTSPQGR
jgi:UDP-N-acetylmuramate--alanine ligase